MKKLALALLIALPATSQIATAQSAAPGIMIQEEPRSGTRDASGPAEAHTDWNNHIFVQQGSGIMMTGGTLVDLKSPEAGEMRGSAISGGKAEEMRPGAYFFLPAGTPYQMILTSGQHVKFLTFKSHK